MDHPEGRPRVVPEVEADLVDRLDRWEGSAELVVRWEAVVALEAVEVGRAGEGCGRVVGTREEGWAAQEAQRTQSGS